MNKLFKLFIHQSLLKHKHYPLLFLLFRITATTTQVTMKLVLKLTVLLCESQNEDSLQWEHNQPLGKSNSS